MLRGATFLAPSFHATVRMETNPAKPCCFLDQHQQNVRPADWDLSCFARMQCPISDQQQRDQNDHARIATGHSSPLTHYYTVALPRDYLPT